MLRSRWMQVHRRNPLRATTAVLELCDQRPVGLPSTTALCGRADLLKVNWPIAPDPETGEGAATASEAQKRLNFRLRHPIICTYPHDIAECQNAPLRFVSARGNGALLPLSVWIWVLAWLGRLGVAVLLGQGEDAIVSHARGCYRMPWPLKVFLLAAHQSLAHSYCAPALPPPSWCKPG